MSPFKCLIPALGLAVASIVAAVPARADGAFTPAQRAEIVQIMRDALKSDPSILRDAVTALQEDDASRAEGATRDSIKAHRTDLFDNAGDPVAGNPHGDVTVVEFYDTRCPYCQKMEPALDELIRSDPGVRVVFKDIPILGPASVLGARALLAAQEQGGYQKLRRILMQPGPAPTQTDIIKAAASLGLDTDRLVTAMNSQAVTDRIAANLALAHALDIQGTPALVIGDTLVPGALELADLKQVVADARKKAK
jgi:protein-disulfide isomerase